MIAEMVRTNLGIYIANVTSVEFYLAKMGNGPGIFFFGARQECPLFVLHSKTDLFSWHWNAGNLLYLPRWAFNRTSKS